MSAGPEVSVVVPTRDRRALLGRTLGCVLRQEGVDLEVVVVDDGSNDGTVEALERLGEPRLRVVSHETSLGVSVARNDGIAAARGRWVALLDDDDLWSPSKLRRQLAAADSADAGWVISSGVEFEPGPRLWAVVPAPAPDVLAATLPHENTVPVGASNVLVRRDVVTDVGGFDPMLSHLADWDLWLRLLRTGPPAVVTEFDVAYRLHPRNLALTDPGGIFDEVERLSARTRDLRGGEPLDPGPVRMWLAVTAWRGGRRGEARRLYREAWRAGHRPAAVRLARSYVPVARLRPARFRGDASSWPPGVEAWLQQALDHPVPLIETTDTGDRS